ncbi:MAG: hypothetical protein Q8P67_01845 [archaeon]|nr:hypothetical protein [archaeon]
MGWRDDVRNKPYLFVHFSKSAGTTLCHLAKKNGERMLKAPGGSHLSCNLPRDGPSVNKFPTEHPPRFRSCQERAQFLVARNVTFNAIEHFLEGHDVASLVCPDELRYGTILREPVERLQSWAYYLKIAPEDMLRWLHGEDDPGRYSSPIAHSQGSFLYPYVDNYVVRTLCGEAVFRLPRGSITQQHLDTALEVLARFEHVMLFDRLQEHLPALQQQLDWQVEAIPRANPSTIDPTFEMLPIHRTLLASFNRWDIDLHNRIKKMSEKSIH